MNKADCRGVARRQDGRFADAVKAGRGRAQASVGDVAAFPFGAVVITVFPFHPILISQKFLHLAYPDPCLFHSLFA